MKTAVAVAEEGIFDLIVLVVVIAVVTFGRTGELAVEVMGFEMEMASEGLAHSKMTALEYRTVLFLHHRNKMRRHTTEQNPFMANPTEKLIQ